MWGAFSVGTGLVAGLLITHPFVRGVALHAILWGLIDAGLAGWGFLRASRESQKYPDEYREVEQTLKVRRLLVVNTLLDIGYFIAGSAVTVIFRDDPFLLGNGVGVIVQALFLFAFDLSHARLLPKRAPTWYDPPS